MRLILCLFFCCAALAGFAAQTLEIAAPQTAGLSGFRAQWDMPLLLSETGPQTVTDGKVKDRGGAAEWKNGAGALAFDALNRSLLVRFPDAAEKIAAEMAHGNVVQQVELVLPFRDEELWPMGGIDYVGPEGYTYRANWGVDDLYRAYRPQWHAVAWALRRPWTADAKLGPTFNAAVNGAVYWTKFGASDTAEDRFAQRFGPAEVSYKQPEGRLNITAVLTDPTFGPTLAARLRRFADCGVLVQKEETYDHRYFSGVYEWATATGGRAILIKAPKLVVTFAPGKADLGGALPPAVDVAALAQQPPVGTPTAVIPTKEQLIQMAAKYAVKPAWMADWQWRHVCELTAAQDKQKVEQPFWYQFVPDYIVDRHAKIHWADGHKVYDQPADPSLIYGLWVDGIIGREPRGWSGFESAREMAQWNLYQDALPAPAQEAIKRYWTAWLMPDRPTAAYEKQRDRTYTDGPLVHPMVDDARVDPTIPKDWWLDPMRGNFDSYWAKTGDWRGNKSFFRSGFCYTISTQNFNTTSSAGALLAGSMIKSELAMADGRHGVETFPMRLYCWSDGSGQEHIDHYYFAVTMAGNKALADYSPTFYDRLVGQSLITKNVEELVSAYHPGLRGFIAGSSRTSLDLVLGEQDGLQSIMHTLSKSGAIRDYGTSKLPGDIATWGHDFPPFQVAQQTQVQPWAPEWVQPMVDDKPLPYEAKHTGWGGVKRTCYLGRNYGLASNAVNEGRVQVMAQWRREPKQVTSMQDLTTLDLRCGVNKTLWVNDGQGRVTPFGATSALQDQNKLLAIMAPYKPDGKVTSLQASIGLFNFQAPAPTWEIYIDGKKIEQLPATCKQGQHITIKDGVTYLGVIPLPATNLGRDAEVVLEEGPMQKAAYYSSNFKAALVINSYFYKSDKPFATVTPEVAAAVAGASGGFALELADAEDYHDFAAFQQHIAATQITTAFDNATSTFRCSYTSGKEKLEAGSVINGKPNLTTWLVNGADPNLPAGIERDTPYCQQGLGHVAKNGATLDAEAGRRIFLLTEPKAGVYCGWNPLPDLTTYRLSVPGGLAVTADGRIGLTRVVVHRQENRIEIDTAYKPGQEKEAGIATAVLISGAATPPHVTLNGHEMANLPTRTVAGKTVYVVSLR